MKKTLSVLLAFGLLSALTACEKATLNLDSAKKDAVNKTEEETSASINLATIAISASDGKIVNVSVEIAESEEERKKGLSNHTSLPQNNGMWFVYQNDIQDPFWMKDTLFPLDMIFVAAPTADSEMKILDIIANTTPNSTELLTPKARYRYVLEVNGGFAAKHNIAIGDTVQQRIGPAQ